MEIHFKKKVLKIDFEKYDKHGFCLGIINDSDEGFFYIGMIFGVLRLGLCDIQYIN